MYDHRANKVVENEDVKVLWDFNIQVDKFIEARRPDIILVRKKRKSASSLILLSRGILEPRWKKMKKIEKYEDLWQEILNCGVYRQQFS